MTRREQFLVLFLGCSLTLGAVALYMRDPPESVESASAARKSNPPAASIGRQGEKKGEGAAAVTAPPAEPSAPGNGADAVVAAPTAPGPTAPEPRQIAVAVAGAIASPGLRRFQEDARVNDAINACGGATEDADLSDINLAARLLDGTTLTVPARHIAGRQGNTPLVHARPSAAALNRREYTISGTRAGSTAGEPATGSAVGMNRGAVTTKPSATAKRAGPIDLNTATEADLDTLPGIGPKLAQEIVRYRSGSAFTTVDDLLNVPGIGPKKLENLRALVTVVGGR